LPRLVRDRLGGALEVLGLTVGGGVPAVTAAAGGERERAHQRQRTGGTRPARPPSCQISRTCHQGSPLRDPSQATTRALEQWAITVDAVRSVAQRHRPDGRYGILAAGPPESSADEPVLTIHLPMSRDAMRP